MPNRPMPHSFPHPEPRPVHIEPERHEEFHHPEPVFVPEPVIRFGPVRPIVIDIQPTDPQVEIRTNVDMVFAWRDGEAGPVQPAGNYFVPLSVANAYVTEGWAVRL